MGISTPSGVTITAPTSLCALENEMLAGNIYRRINSKMFTGSGQPETFISSVWTIKLNALLNVVRC